MQIVNRIYIYIYIKYRLGYPCSIAHSNSNPNPNPNPKPNPKPKPKPKPKPNPKPKPKPNPKPNLVRGAWGPAIQYREGATLVPRPVAMRVCGWWCERMGASVCVDGGVSVWVRA